MGAARLIALSAVLGCFTAATEANAIGFIISASSIADKENYLQDPSFAPFFDLDATRALDFEGPWSKPLGSGNHFNLGLVGSTYQSQGVVFGANDRFMGGTRGFGPFDGPTVVGNGAYPYDGPIEAHFVKPGTSTRDTYESVAFHVADGPTNEVRAQFFDINMKLLGTVTAPRGAGQGGWAGFLGYSDPRGIFMVRVLNGAGDDYYIDSFTYGFRPGGGPPQPVPEPGTLALAGTGLLGLVARRRKSP